MRIVESNRETQPELKDYLVKNISNGLPGSEIQSSKTTAKNVSNCKKYTSPFPSSLTIPLLSKVQLEQQKRMKKKSSTNRTMEARRKN